MFKPVSVIQNLLFVEYFRTKNNQFFLVNFEPKGNNEFRAFSLRLHVKSRIVGSAYNAALVKAIVITHRLVVLRLDGSRGRTGVI
jgi:hypothetical protein